MRQRLIFFLPLVCLAFEEKEASKPPPPPESILQRVWANRASTDLALKGRLFIERNRHMPVEVRIKNLADEVRTVYRGDKLELLVVQVPRRSTRFYLAGRGELTTPQQQMERVLGSWISYYDLGLPFLSWPNPKFLGEDRMRGQDCYVLEVKSDSAPYRRVKLWIHNEYFALLKAEAFDADENPVKRITVTSFKR
ncbi:MAG: outer membrane lipoprotein-sorting protein, partial [Verrucomicrobiae bacterium]|nr:outer membrane lipoprotein-sorting protein [Verrucomicrobiae bacterium]